MAEWRWRTAEELLRLVEERQKRLGPVGAVQDAAEEGYRRGYHAGWIKAIMTLRDAVAVQRRVLPIPLERAYEAAWTFWESGPLADWLLESPPMDGPLPRRHPPDMPIRRPTAASIPASIPPETDAPRPDGGESSPLVDDASGRA